MTSSSLPPFVDIRRIAQPLPAQEAMKLWDGFTAISPFHMQKQPLRSIEVTERGARKDITLRSESFMELGCLFVKNVHTMGAGFSFLDGAYIMEPVHTSELGRHWIHENPPAPTYTRTLDNPALLVFGPGYQVYGHALMDYLPRIRLAQDTLGRAFEKFVIPCPDDMPEWFFPLAEFMCGVPRGRFFLYAAKTERLVCAHACVPTYTHTMRYALPRYIMPFYRRLVRPSTRKERRRLCISRKHVENATRSIWRVMDNREEFEHEARRRNYEIIYPEDIPLTEQAALFNEASHIIGEHGSALHNAIFSEPDTVVGFFPKPNPLQDSIAVACRQWAVYSPCLSDMHHDPSGCAHYTLPTPVMMHLFDAVDSVP